jgi:hypothetical protein
MISKSTFKEFSLEHHNGNYFLRPDRILGCYHVDHNYARPKLTLKLIAELEMEKKKEEQVFEKLILSEKKHKSNVIRVNKSVSMLWSALHEIKLPTVPSRSASTSSATSSSSTAGGGRQTRLFSLGSSLLNQRNNVKQTPTTRGDRVESISESIELTETSSNMFYLNPMTALECQPDDASSESSDHTLNNHMSDFEGPSSSEL